MKKIIYFLIVVFALALGSHAQTLAKPTKLPVLATEQQEKLIREGNSLHDAKKYDQAISKYQQVLTENPDCTVALYEMAMSQYSKGDRVRAMETAYRGAAYLSDELGSFYEVIGSCMDDQGKPDDAIKIYREGEDILKRYPDQKRFLAEIYYNLSLTLVKLSRYDEARAELKNAVQANYAYASPHYLLALVFNGTRYKAPAFLAAARFISLEYDTDKSRNAAAIIADVLKPAAKDPKTGNTQITLDFLAPKDEGYFGGVELLLPMLGVRKDEKDNKKTDSEIFFDSIDAVISMLGEDKKLASFFVGKQYVPFMVDLKKNGYTETFGNMVLSNRGNDNAAKWLDKNDGKVKDFQKWAKEYHLPS